MSSNAARAQDAMKVSDYPTAVKELTAALKTSQSPLWLIQRSISYQRTGQHELALADADNALLASISRGKRDLIATSYFRRAVALHGLGRFGDARLCLTWCNKRNEKEKGLTIWMAKIKSDYEKAGGDAAECNQTSVKEVPDKVEEVSQDKPKEEKKPAEKKVPNVVPVVQTPTPKEKVRQEWYQSTATVTIEIFAKGVPKESAEVKIEEGSVSLPFPVSNLLTCHSSKLAFPSLLPTIHTTTPSHPSSPQSMCLRALSESRPTRSRSSCKSPDQASSGPRSKAPNQSPHPPTSLPQRYQMQF